ncbi:MAG TPA: 30S ribosomal protein S20 [Clostridia bacterium]|nr:30S ribosomal protein S20 [Clostridia bacterium]
MPIIKSAQKALRQTRKRTLLNKSKKRALKAQIKKLKTKKDSQGLGTVYSLADKMAKSKVFHKNKAQRIKSQAAKIVGSKPA